MTAQRQGHHERREFVYLILAHHQPRQLIRLIGTLRTGSPDAAIVLHHDAKSPLPDSRTLKELNVHLVEHRITVGWADASQVDALLESLREVLGKFVFSWLTVLSGQDYPLRPLSLIEDDLRHSSCHAFVKAAPAGPYRSRYYLRYRTLPRFAYAHRVPASLRRAFNWGRRQLNLTQRWVRIEGGPRNSPLRLGLFSRNHPFDETFVCYKGSDWFVLSHEAAAYLLDFGQKNPKVLEHYRHTFIPSESYYQTVLYNAKNLRICNDHRRFILWDDNRLAHPVTLTMEHFDALTESGKDFGRKFDMDVDASVLDALDRIVINETDS